MACSKPQQTAPQLKLEPGTPPKAFAHITVPACPASNHLSAISIHLKGQFQQRLEVSMMCVNPSKGQYTGMFRYRGAKD